MFIFDISNPLTLILMLAVTVLLIFLAQEVKKSYIAAVMLFAYLIILIVHVAQIATLPEEFRYMVTTISRCIAIDFVFVLITFFSYLWTDDIETKEFPLLTIITENPVPSDIIKEFLSIKGVNRVSIY